MGKAEQHPTDAAYDAAQVVSHCFQTIDMQLNLILLTIAKLPVSDARKKEMRERTLEARRAARCAANGDPD